MDAAERLDRAAELLAQSSNVLFITGAGLSADSGLPTYRGVGGLYEDATVDEGISIELALSGWMLRTEPELTWKYIAQIEQVCRGASFNRGHEVIAEIERHLERVWTLTQNVDGLHSEAGAQNLIEIHGNIHHLLCTRCEYRRTARDFSELTVPPHCPDCNGIVRPDVVLFGEALPLAQLTRLDQELERGFDLIFSVGTSSGFPYISEPVLDAIRAGIPTIEINPGTTEVSDLVELQLPMRAAEALDGLWSRFRARS